MKTTRETVSVPARGLAASLPTARAPLVLDPSHVGGWFGGKALATWDPVAVRHGLHVADAAAYLDDTYAGVSHAVCAVVASYDGLCTVLEYEGYASRTGDTWHVSGDLDRGPFDIAATSRMPVSDTSRSLITAPESGMDAPGFVAAVRSIHDAIRAGDVYLVNLTYRVRGRRAVMPNAAYATLSARAGSMMNAFVSDGETTLVSVSPERFLSLTAGVDGDGGNIAEIWPIKGTRPRAECPDCDMHLAEELRESEKERAEHVMVVDLERNDLGRVSRTGSVDVDPLMDVAQTPYCHQMYSTVRSVVDGERPVERLLGATFPCGSVTGTPKIAAMEVIDSLELSPRGPYTGSLIVATHGRLDSSVLIRTLVDDGGHAEWGTGGGITIDSDPHEEWLETRLKAQPVLGAE